jgi:tetratricopeptide (TPR) repeat protein
MAGVLAAWWRWIERGRLPPVLPAIAVAALLVDLSAAGGIGLSSVAGSFWLLLAVGLWAVDAGRVRRMSRSFAVVGLIAALLLTLACYTFAYAPVLACQAAIRTAYRQPARAEKLLQDAVCDDPWAAKPRELLAALALDEWRREPDQQRQRQFERYNAMLLEVDSASSAAWLAAGDGYFEIAMKTQHARDRQKAIDCYRQAVERYPNSSQYRAKLALAWQAAGRTAEFRREADIALKLDHITPHESMKLPPETRKQLRQGAPQP